MKIPEACGAFKKHTPGDDDVSRWISYTFVVKGFQQWLYTVYLFKINDWILHKEQVFFFFVFFFTLLHAWVCLLKSIQTPCLTAPHHVAEECTAVASGLKEMQTFPLGAVNCTGRGAFSFFSLRVDLIAALCSSWDKDSKKILHVTTSYTGFINILSHGARITGVAAQQWVHLLKFLMSGQAFLKHIKTLLSNLFQIPKKTHVSGWI